MSDNTLSVHISFEKFKFRAKKAAKKAGEAAS